MKTGPSTRVAVFIIALLFFLPLAWISINSFRTTLLHAQMEKGETIARLLDASISSDAQLRDEIGLFANIQKNMWLEPDLLSITVNLPDSDSPSANTLRTALSNDGTKRGTPASVDSQEAFAGDTLISRIVDDGNKRYVRVVTPIHIAKRLAGTLEIALSMDYVDGHVASQVRKTFLAYFLAILLFIAVAFRSINLLMVRPIEELNRGAVRIAKGDLDYRVNVKADGAIGQLASSFWKMTSDLKESRASLHERTIDLEAEIEERKQAQQQVLETETRFQNLAQTANDAIIGLDSAGKVAIWNDAAVRIFGYEADEATLHRLETLIIPEHERDQASLAIHELLADGTSPRVGRSLETVGIRRDGQPVPLELSISSMRVGAGWHVTVIARDISERKQLQAEMLKAQKLESIGILAGGIAHDFNNVLTHILGHISFAKTYAKPEDEMFELLTEAENASYRARGLTQQLLTFSRGGTPVRQSVDVTKILTESANLVLRGSSSQCSFSIPEAIATVEIDEGQMGQVFNNLFINAEQAMPNGGLIRVLVNNEEIREIDQTPIAAGKYVRIDIADQGPGIDPDEIAKIFDPYFTTKANGSGLGLAVSYSIVNSHRGYIMAQSDVGVGTIFSIHLPAAQGKAVTNTHERNTMTGTGRILVMDDDAEIRNLVEKMLTRLGYEVELASEGGEAIKLYETAQTSNMVFDATILDLTVRGGMGGAEAMERLLKVDPHVKAVVSSGYSTDPVMSNYQEYGFTGVIPKPYKMQDLSEVLHDVIKEGNGNGVA